MALHTQEGASAVEYALLIAGIATIIVASIFLFGGSVAAMFNDSNSCLNAGAASLC